MQSLFTKEQFLQFKAAFKARAQAGSNDSADMMLYSIVRGLDAKRGFSPTSNLRKLANGHSAWYGYSHAKDCILSRVYAPWRKIWDPLYIKATFGIDTTEDQLKAIAEAAGWRL